MELYNIDKNKAFSISQKALIMKEGKLLVLKNNAEKLGHTSQWEIPGGLLEIDETIEKGLIREVMEETGLKISVGEVMAVWDHWQHGFKLRDGRVLDIRVIGIAFICKKIGGIIKLSEEHNQFMWADKGELKELDFDLNSKSAITKYLELNRS